jgi:exosortase F-associated protein
MRKEYRWLLGVTCLLGLVAIFLSQHVDWASKLIYFSNVSHRFLWNRTIRFLLNDLFAIGLLYALFPEKKYVVFAFWVQAAGFIFLLLPYFFLKVQFPRYNGPLINFLHRIVLNPTLLLLLIPAFYWQKKRLI